MKKYLITYTDNEIITISDAPEQGVIANGTNMVINTMENALLMFSALGFDITELEEVNVRENTLTTI